MSYRGRMFGDYMPGYGDPGFLSGIGHVLGTIGKVVGGTALGFVTGGGIKGAIAGALGGTARATASNIEEATLGAGGSQSAYTPALRKAHAAIVARSKRLGTTQPIGSLPVGTAHALGGGGGGGGGGYHPSKRHLAALARGLTRAPPRMNWANSRALGRAGRRIGSFLKHARKFMRFVGVHHKGRAVFKVGRRKR